MDMDNPAPNLLSLPNEILTPILSSVRRHDLVSLRLTCRCFRISVNPYLFRTITTTWSRLHELLLLSNTPTLAPLVEELIFQEQCFNVGDRNLWPYNDHDREVDLLVNGTCYTHGFNSWDTAPDSLGFIHPKIHPKNEEHDEWKVSVQRFRPELGRPFLEEMIAAVLREYKRRNDYQTSETAFMRLWNAMRGLPNACAVKMVDSRDNGCPKSLPACEELTQLNEYFPIDEGKFHTLFRASPDPTQKGFLMMLRVFAVLQRPMELIAEQNYGLMKMGCPFIWTSDVPELFLPKTLDLETDPVKGFKCLRKLELCVDIPSRLAFNELTGSLLLNGLKLANQLEELKLIIDNSYDRDRRSLIPIFDDQMSTGPSYAKLKTLQLEYFPFTLPQGFSAVLMNRTPALRKLSFVECKLTEGRWKDVVQDLSDNETFTLDEFRLENSSCREDIEKEDIARDPGFVGRDMERWVLMPSQVSSQALTYFINTPGAENPLDSRKWRFCYRESHEDNNLKARLAMRGIEYGADEDEFENASDWTPEEQMGPGREWSDEDTDGPEFDSDYDFSAEAISDDEMDIDVDEVRMEGSEVNMETSIHVHRNKRERGLLPPSSPQIVAAPHSQNTAEDTNDMVPAVTIWEGEYPREGLPGPLPTEDEEMDL